MTDQEIAEAIAEFFGWKFVDDDPDFESYWTKDGIKIAKNLVNFDDYLYNLNTIHHIEKKLTSNQVGEYDKALKDALLNRCRTCDWTQYPDDYTWHATAKDRAECIVKVIGKWKD